MVNNSTNKTNTFIFIKTIKIKGFYDIFITEDTTQGRIQDFKLGGGALKKIVPSGGMCKIFWGISCEKSRFYAKKSYFFPIFGGGACRVHPPWIRPCNI